MENRIENLTWKPMWTSHIGCLKGCLDHLGVEITEEWLYGASGHTFILNIHKVLCPSGPTAWRKGKFLDLIQNVGVRQDEIVAYKTMKNFKDKQKETWDRVRQSIDLGQPCFGWELLIPEYYVITGYDDTGYFFVGPTPQDCNKVIKNGMNSEILKSVSLRYISHRFQALRMTLASLVKLCNLP